MSWIQRVGKYGNYVAKNYKLRYNNINRVSLENEINKYISNPPNIKSIINGIQVDGYKTSKGYSPCYGRKQIFSYEPLSSKINIERNTKWEHTHPEEKFEIFENIAELI